MFTGQKSFYTSGIQYYVNLIGQKSFYTSGISTPGKGEFFRKLFNKKQETIFNFLLTRTAQCYNITMLQYYNVTILQGYTVAMLQCYNVSLVEVNQAILAWSF